MQWVKSQTALQAGAWPSGSGLCQWLLQTSSQTVTEHNKKEVLETSTSS